MRSARRDSTFRWGRRGSTARSSRAQGSRASSGGSRSSPTGNRPVAGTRSCSASGRSTACSSPTRGRGPPSSTSCASGSWRKGWRSRPRAGSHGREGGEQAQAFSALARRAYGRERRLLEGAVRLEPQRLLAAPANQRYDDAFGQLALAEPHSEVLLHDLERLLRRGKEGLARALAEPERAADAARDEDGLRLALVEPGSRHRPAQLLQGLSRRAVLVDEGEDRLGVDGHVRLVPFKVVPGEDLLVVDDDPVVDALDGAVADGVVVGGDLRVPLRVVAHVQEGLARVLRDVEAVEERARSGALFVKLEVTAVGAIGVANRVGAPLGDPCEQGLARECPVDPARVMQAVSGYSTHWNDARSLAGRPLLDSSRTPSSLFDAQRPSELAENLPRSGVVALCSRRQAGRYKLRWPGLYLTDLRNRSPLPSPSSRSCPSPRRWTIRSKRKRRIRTTASPRSRRIR